MRVTNRPSDSVEGETLRLGRELHLGADVEEGEVAVHEVVGDACCFVVDVDLAGQDILCLQ